MATSCQPLDIVGMFGEHVEPMHAYPTKDWQACVNGATYPNAGGSSCTLQCKHGYTASLPGHIEQGNIPIWIKCETNSKRYVYTTDIGARLPEWGAGGYDDDTVPADDLNCQPNECISTSDQAEVDQSPATHILCENGLIASGKTGACKCSGEEPTTQTPQTTTTQTTTTSSAVSLRIQIQAKMLLVALSTLSTLSFLV